ncbi:hypothetical protein DFJ58DRAFT_706024 [Suillus subalutaceus]|uniref:uncharacterized protein n=1 Tax=Suillus subalutaceus TaxID=48586 RepID=UPI001B87025A|nr:uncharacterized protein DFJ58DRAFT_706024 [Suillus subalutaceus]KAG1845914.1 hypothetical protein DFJ58DRAFT_706024 [Suillus subalutaceus]
MVDWEIHNKLSLLALYLKNLPDTIPLVHASATQYGFDFYAADDEDILDMGEIGALNRAFEIRLGQRNNGPIIFKERGVGLEGVVDVLKSYFEKHEHSNEVALLHKWLDDLITAAEHAYASAKVPVSTNHKIGVKLNLYP